MVQPIPAQKQPCQSRPWLTRKHGECAFPVGGEGAETRSCCRPCEPPTRYCRDHAKLIKGPRGPSVEDLLREYARFLA